MINPKNLKKSILDYAKNYCHCETCRKANRANLLTTENKNYRHCEPKRSLGVAIS